MGKLDSQTQIDLNIAVTQDEFLMNDKLTRAREPPIDDVTKPMKQAVVPLHHDIWWKMERPKFLETIPPSTAAALKAEHKAR